jgi:hypothetical protein
LYILENNILDRRIRIGVLYKVVGVEFHCFAISSRFELPSSEEFAGGAVCPTQSDAKKLRPISVTEVAHGHNAVAGADSRMID